MPQTKIGLIIELHKQGVLHKEIAQRTDSKLNYVYSTLSRWRKATGQETKQPINHSRHACLFRAKNFPLVIKSLQDGMSQKEVAKEYGISSTTASNWMTLHNRGYTVNPAGEFVAAENFLPYESVVTPEAESLAKLLGITPRQLVERAVLHYKKHLAENLV